MQLSKTKEAYLGLCLIGATGVTLAIYGYIGNHRATLIAGSVLGGFSGLGSAALGVNKVINIWPQLKFKYYADTKQKNKPLFSKFIFHLISHK